MKTTLLQLAIIVILFSFVGELKAQSDTEFWFAAPDLQNNHGDRPIFLRMATAQQASRVTISIPANPSFTPLIIDIAANSSYSADLTAYIAAIENVVQNTPQQKGILVTATNRITCFYDIANASNGDMYALKGKNGLGTKFTLPFQNTLSNQATSTNRGPFTTDFIIVATENNTTVHIQASCDLTGHPTRIFDIVLNKGESYVCSITSLIAADKPDGTIVTSDKPIAITTKDDSLKYITGTCYDTAGDQLIPDRMAGNQFILIKSYFTAPNPDYYYVFAIESNTKVFVDGVLKATLANPGDSYPAALSLESSFIETSAPAHIFQISGFGCELGGAVIPAIKCTGSQQVNITRADGNLSFYVNVLAPANIINDFTLNGSTTLIHSGLFNAVPGTSNAWYYARISVPSSVAGTNQSVIIKNPSGKFHVGVIHGGGGTTRFGYFSDFSANAISFTKQDNPTIPLNNIETVCYNGNFQIDAHIPDANTYSWTGPNGFTSNSSYLSFSNFNTPNIGSYQLQVETQGCGIANASIELQMEKPVADFTFSTTGCEGDRVVFTSPSTAVNWIWDFKNGGTLNSSFPTTNRISFPNAGNYDVSLKVESARGCISDEFIKTLKLSSIPQPAYTISPITCINKNIIFTDATPSLAVGTIQQWRWDLDNGSPAFNATNNSNQQTNYTTWGPKYPKLTTVSNTGCVSAVFVLPNVVVHPNPLPAFNLPEVCLDDASAQFTDATTSPDGNTTFSYQWNFNAGTPAISPGPNFTPTNLTEKNPIVQYNASGFYKVSMEVTGQGCVSTLTKDFTVNGANPNPTFVIDNTLALCSNAQVNITNNSSVGIGDITKLEIYWDANDPNSKFVDESPFIGKTYNHLYPNFQSPSSLNYPIKLVAYSGNAATCNKSTEQIVTLQATPSVVFDPIPGICLESAPRQITQASLSSTLTGSFSYSGTGVSTTGMFDPQINGAGTVFITAKFTTDQGCVNEAQQNIVVWPRPVANFSFNNINCEKTPIQFQSNSIANAGSLYSWSWNFGDATPIKTYLNENVLPYTFATSNNYTVGLTVKTTNGCTSLPKSQNVLVHPLPQPAFDLPNVCLPEGKAIFTNHSSLSEASGLPLSYLWEYGDPQDLSTTQGNDGQHNYLRLGTYPVKLTTTSTHGCKSILTQNLSTIFPQPKADFTSLDSACLGTSLNFKDKSDGSGSIIDTWHWDFGEGSTSTAIDPPTPFRNAGSYLVKHYIVTKEGCLSNIQSKTIPIYDYPQIDAGSDMYAMEDAITLIPATARGNAVLFQWSPGKFIDTTTILTPHIVYPTDDYLNYTLKVTGRGACVSNDNLHVTVLHKPVIANTFTPNGDGHNERWIIKNIDNYPSNTVEVYTPQGQLVYKANNYTNSNGWDGTTHGKPLPVGTYYYVINPRLGRKIITGYVTILR